MGKLEELIEELCPDGVEFSRIDELCIITRGRVMSKDYIRDNAGNYPVYSSQTENNGELGKISTYDYEGEFLTWTTDGANAGSVFYRDGKFSVTNVCGLLKIQDDRILTKYLYYALVITAPNYVNRGMGNPKLMSNVMGKIRIPIPPIEVQREIVRILDNFTELTAELTAELTTELTARKKQYEYYRDDLMNLSNDKNIVTIGEVVEKIGTINWNKCEETKKYIDLTSVDKEVHSIIKKLVSDVNSENAPSRARQLIKSGDILFGGTRPMLKRYCIVPKEYDNQICSTGYIVLRVKNNLIIKEYLYYILGTQSFYNYIESNQQGASYPSIGDKVLKQYTFNLPSLREQEHIVKILNEFEKLYYDISEGIQAEIEARKKQYEYYRDKLLTFKKLEE